MPPTPRSQAIRVCGQQWELAFRSLKRRQLCGLCEYDRKRVSVCTSMRGLDRLDTICHELLHACQGFASEEHVAEVATTLATVLWQLGYRLEDDDGKS